PEQPARRLAPDDADRGAQPDRRLCLRSGGRGAVERPLQRALVDLDAHPRVIAELDPLGQRVVAALRDGDAQLATLAERDQRPALAIRAGAEAADADDGAADARAPSRLRAGSSTRSPAPSRRPEARRARLQTRERSRRGTPRPKPLPDEDSRSPSRAPRTSRACDTGGRPRLRPPSALRPRPRR